MQSASAESLLNRTRDKSMNINAEISVNFAFFFRSSDRGLKGWVSSPESGLTPDRFQARVLVLTSNLFVNLGTLATLYDIIGSWRCWAKNIQSLTTVCWFLQVSHSVFLRLNVLGSSVCSLKKLDMALTRITWSFKYCKTNRIGRASFYCMLF